MKHLRKWLSLSVFRRLPKGSSMEHVLSIMFHRLSATLYAIYCAWAVVSIIDGIPSLVAANGSQWQVIFSSAVLIFAAPSAFGATFWPLFARLELYAGLAFTTLLVLYLTYLLGSVLFGDGSWAGVVIIASVLVVPACRFAIVVMFLLQQAETRHRGNPWVKRDRESGD